MEVGDLVLKKNNGNSNSDDSNSNKPSSSTSATTATSNNTAAKSSKPAAPVSAVVDSKKSTKAKPEKRETSETLLVRGVTWKGKDAPLKLHKIFQKWGHIDEITVIDEVASIMFATPGAVQRAMREYKPKYHNAFTLELGKSSEPGSSAAALNPSKSVNLTVAAVTVEPVHEMVIKHLPFERTDPEIERAIRAVFRRYGKIETIRLDRIDRRRRINAFVGWDSKKSLNLCLDTFSSHSQLVFGREVTVERCHYSSSVVRGGAAASGVGGPSGTRLKETDDRADRRSDRGRKRSKSLSPPPASSSSSSSRYRTRSSQSPPRLSPDSKRSRKENSKAATTATATEKTNENGPGLIARGKRSSSRQASSPSPPPLAAAAANKKTQKTTATVNVKQPEPEQQQQQQQQQQAKAKKRVPPKPFHLAGWQRLETEDGGYVYCNPGMFLVSRTPPFFLEPAGDFTFDFEAARQISTATVDD